MRIRSDIHPTQTRRETIERLRTPEHFRARTKCRVDGSPGINLLIATLHPADEAAPRPLELRCWEAPGRP